MNQNELQLRAMGRMLEDARARVKQAEELEAAARPLFGLVLQTMGTERALTPVQRELTTQIALATHGLSLVKSSLAAFEAQLGKGLAAWQATQGGSTS